MTLEERIKAAWSRETSYCPKEWSKENPARGQCAVTALVVQDQLGGEILKCDVVNDDDSHFYNRLPNDSILDLTKSQFPSVSEFTNEKNAERNKILSHPGTQERYELLLKNLNMETKIKAICFDLDGVYFTPHGKNSFHQALSEEFGADPEAVNNFMYRSETMGQFVRGKITPPEFWQAMREQLDIITSDEELLARWVRDYEIDERVRKAVLSAKEKGYITCVCTNNNAARLGALEEKFHFYQDFDHIVSAHEVGHTKPTKEMYQALLDTVGVDPSELVYADDNPERIKGAEELGITVFVFETFDQFLSELEKLGVNL